jgi:hypothetical protein
VETAVSCDGTWQRRGFTSLHGCVTIISMENGQMLDIKPLSKVSKAWKKHASFPIEVFKAPGHKSRSFLCCWSKGSRSTSCYEI